VAQECVVEHLSQPLFFTQAESATIAAIGAAGSIAAKNETRTVRGRAEMRVRRCYRFSLELALAFLHPLLHRCPFASVRLVTFQTAQTPRGP
jgi:hypothetical protein